MAKIQEQVQGLGGAVLVVSFAPERQLTAFLREMPQPFAVVSDPDRHAYRAFGLETATLLGFFRPGVAWRFMKLICRGWLPKLPPEKTDVLQLGGDFVLDREGRIVYAHASQDAADRPSGEELLAAMRRAATREP